MKDKAGMNKVLVFIRERTAIRQRPDIPSPEPPVSIAYVFGTVLMFLLGFQVVTGLALSAFYSPSSTDAWGSVAYLEDQVTGWVRWGSLVRGVHHHGAGAIVIIAGVHLVQTALSGAYKRPRELVWWLGVALLLVVLAWAVTGYVLPWDQAGYWANQVEVGIAAGTPLLGEPIRDLALGGNDYGNLTLTRFYMLHVGLLPLVVTGLVIWHVVLARRHGRTPIGKWPMRQSRVHQRLRDAIACAILLTILLAFVVAQGGAGLSAPADPSQAYDARPLWYFRWLFALRELAGGTLEQFVAMAAPAIVVGFLVALPLLDKSPERGIDHRRLWLGILAGLLALIAALTVVSFARDSGDHELAKRRAEADQLALRARALARTYGVPATGGADIWSMSPMWRGRVLFAKMCAGCHDAASDPKERVGPIIAPGHGDRAWLRAFLKSPSDPRFWGKTKLAKTDAAMQSADEMELSPAQVEDLVELLIAQSGETEVDRAKLVRSKEPFEKCMDCHTLNEGEAGSSGPNLFGLHSRAFYLSFISNPKLPVHMGDKSEMPRFDTDLSLHDRDALAEYLVWLRTATQADLDRLGPL